MYHISFIIIGMMYTYPSMDDGKWLNHDQVVKILSLGHKQFDSCCKF